MQWEEIHKPEDRRGLLSPRRLLRSIRDIFRARDAVFVKNEYWPFADAQDWQTHMRE